MDFELPDNIKPILEGYTVEDGPSGLSGASIYKFKKESNVYFLKIIDVNNRFVGELDVEYMILKWLDGKFPAPQIIAFEKTTKKHFLLMTEVDGTTLEELFNQNVSIEEIVTIYAESLKFIHNIDIQDCPYKADDEAMLLKAKENMELGINIENMEEEYKNLSVRELYDKLLLLKPKKHENVFIHGDYCSDNIIIKNNKLNGIIDVGRGGIGDKYKDIALAVRSIRHDFGEQWLDLFFDKYGMTEPNWDKIEFYIIMDEFY